ncbi:hypothetical protein ElyMa_000015900 [Elysia marginata]|uniref:Syndecan/Neurexin domain-containing protein n=1 Tax=Elysia marginata TaxID=1093978 RepID=A0AAV4EB95_9GAST|nr:hypothetical protein ElyMa_000015900 [Elysia marginata]
MPSGNRQLLPLRLVFLACLVAFTQSENEASQIAPTPTVVGVASAQNASETNNSEAVSSESAAPAATSASASLSGSENVIQPSMANSESAFQQLQSSSESATASAVLTNFFSQPLSSSEVVPVVNASSPPSASPLSAVSPNSVVVINSGDLSSSEALASMLSAISANSSVEIQPSQTEFQMTTVSPAAAQSESPSAGNSSAGDFLPSASATAQTASVTANVVPTSASISQSVASSPTAMVPDASAEISPSSTVVSPASSSAAVPVPSGSGSGAAGGSSPQQEEKKKEGGGGGGMSSGAKAAVGIFVSLAIVGLIALVVVLYRRNYLTPRSIKSLMKGGVRYQTHDDSMSYNDEGMLILPDRR